MKRIFVVDSDALDIVQRLREIDKSYCLVFDVDVKKFCLYAKVGDNFDQIGRAHV